MIRRIVSGLLFLTLLTSCNRSQKKVVAVIPKGTSHLFWQTVQAGAIAAGQAFNVEILWNGTLGETEYARQIQIVDSMVARHVDGMAVAAQDRNALIGSIDRAVASGMPVTVFDSGLDSTNFMTFVATDNYAAGQMAARKLAELVGKRGKVAVVMNAPGSVSTMDRERGFDESMAKEFPNIQVVARQFGMSDRAKAMAAAENMLTAHPDLAGMFASAEPSSVGASQAFKARGLAGKTKLVAFDTSDGMTEDVRAGVIDAMVAQDPFKMGYEAVRTVVDKLNGKTPPKRMDLQAVVITKADLEKPEIKALLFPDLKKYLK
ncbi:MAG: sugar ABC transporter substrate-binding protein [Bryobacterales bacterium]|nr:sugar ABC transporter substrate-binding protein [Bryobacterales bacterium]